MVVKLDPLPTETRSGLILPSGTSGEENQRTGTVLRVGPGRKVKGAVVPVGVSPGDRVVFFRANLEHQQGKQMVGIIQELEEGTGMIRQDDVLWVEES